MGLCINLFINMNDGFVVGLCINMINVLSVELCNVSVCGIVNR